MEKREERKYVASGVSSVNNSFVSRTQRKGVEFPKEGGALVNAADTTTVNATLCHCRT
jgi:hypothetical protein